MESGSGRGNIDLLYSEIRELESQFKQAKQMQTSSPLRRPSAATLHTSGASTAREVRDEIRMMEQASRRKEKALVEMTRDLATARDQRDQLQRDLASKNRVIHTLMDEKKALMDVDKQNQYAIKGLERDLQEASRRLESAKARGVGRGAMTGRVHEDFGFELESKTQEIESLRSQNSILIETMRKYDKALEVLKSIATDGGDKSSLQAKLQALNALKGSAGMMIEISEAGADIPGDYGATMKQLNEESRLHKAEISSLGEKWQLSEKTNKAQHHRIISLTDRLDFLAARIKEGVVRRSTLQEAAELGHGRQPKSSSERYSLERELMVPSALHEFVEKEVSVLASQVKELEESIEQRTEAAEVLQRKLEVSEKARETEAKKLRQENKELRDELGTAHKQMEQIDAQYQVRETELKREKFELKSKLDRSSFDNAKGPSKARRPEKSTF